MWFIAALLAAGGFAGLVDSALGMGFGVTTTSFLLTMGLAPAAASATVHAARIGASVAGGTAHLKLGNVERGPLLWLALPGCAGGVLGALLLVQVNNEAARPLVAAFLLCVGALMLWRHFAAPRRHARRASLPRTGVLGFVAGAVDAFGGGGWGPIATPGLIVVEGREPRKAVGTVDLAQVFVSATIAGAFIVLLGVAGLRWDIVLAVGAGGAVAAPLGARMASRLKPRRLAGLVGALLVTLNARTLATSIFHVDPGAASTIMLGLVVVIFALMLTGGFERAPPAPEAPGPQPPGPAP